MLAPTADGTEISCMTNYCYLCTMIGFLKATAAKIWAGRAYRRLMTDRSTALRQQEDLLLSLVRTAEKTLFGREHRFEEVSSYQTFKQHVPVRDYEAIRPYIEKMKKGQASILWPGLPKYFAKTSGTTSGAKYIPISDSGIEHQVAAARSALLQYIHQKGNAEFVKGKMIFLQGSPELEEMYGIQTGRLSGIVAHHIPAYLQKNRLPSWETNIIDDWETKVDAIIRETERQNMTLISGIPPWLVMYFEKLCDKHRKPVGQLFPKLQLIVTGGVNYEPYREKINQLIGREVDIVQTFPASEGFFGYQDDYRKEGLLLLTNQGIFYEFIPLSEYGSPSARRLTLSEVELNTDYAMFISTDSGLWAYDIGDVVRFISLDPFKILVSGRTKHFTSAFGEHVIAIEAEEAMRETTEQLGITVSEYHLAPQVTPQEGLPYHEWFVEMEKEAVSLEKMEELLDLALRKRNSYYDDLISGKILRPLKITLLPPGTFHSYARKHGKLGGQNKLPRLANNRMLADELSAFFSD